MKDENTWVGTWASAQYAIPQSDPRAPVLKDSTFRQMIRVSLGGEKLRFTFSNEYGESPVEIKSAAIAKPTVIRQSNIDTATSRFLSFNGGKESITIEAGKKAVSDEIEYPVKALDKIALSVYFGNTPETLTHHGASRSNGFLKKGNAVADEIAEDEVSKETVLTSWYFLCNTDVLSDSSSSRSIICFGDSITDGYGTEQPAPDILPDSYLRWVDVFMEKLSANPAMSGLSVINMGIGGNAIFGGQGQAAKDRFDRDVLEQCGAGYLIFLIGVNDILFSPGTDPSLPDRMIEEYGKMISKANAAGIKVLAGTITPMYGSQGHTDAKEAMRQKVNNWLSDSYKEGKVAALVDFANHIAVTEDGKSRIKDIYDRDGLHPGIAGYRAMGELVYEVFEKSLRASSPFGLPVP